MSATESPPTTPADGRDALGRFTKGNKLAIGNPFARQVAGFRSAVIRTMTPEKLEKLAEKVYAQAMAGDLAAARLILLYTVGKPTEAVNPDDLETDEFAQHQAHSASSDEILKVLYPLVPLECANAMLRVALPVARDQLANTPLEPHQPREPEKAPEPVTPEPEPAVTERVERPANTPAMPTRGAWPFGGPPPVTEREKRTDQAANRRRSKPTAPPRRDREKPPDRPGENGRGKPPEA